MSKKIDTKAVIVMEDGEVRSLGTSGITDAIEWIGRESKSFERDAIQVEQIRSITFIKDKR